MSYVRQPHATRNFGLPLVGVVLSAARRFSDRRKMNALLSMDDFMLKDIGLSRSDVQHEATKSLWRD